MYNAGYSKRVPHVNNIYKSILKGGIKISLLFSTYENISNMAANIVKGISPYTSHFLACYGDDFLGGFALSSLYKEILSHIKTFRINKYADMLGSSLSFLSLTSLELLQKYHMIYGCYDKNDIKMFALGSLTYMCYRFLSH